jgi:thiol-disulfide isomerase/thioredoxin
VKFVLNEAELKFTSQFYCVCIYASWMPFSDKIPHLINKIEGRFNFVEFIAIDINSFKTIIKIHNVSSIPMFIFFKNGLEYSRVTGLPTVDILQTKLQELVDI